MILVAGATGSVGGRIVKELRQRGVPVRALVRPASDYAALQQAGVPMVFGDLTDAASLASACAGVDAVVTTASATKRGDDDVMNVDLRGNCSLVDAARTAGARRFVFVSTYGADAASPVPAFRAKGAAESYVRESGLLYTILQPNAFMDVWFPALIERTAFAGEPVTLVGEALRRHAFIAERDVAAFALAALRMPASANRTVALGGPAAITFRDVVRAYETAAGREIPVRSVAPGQPLPGLPAAVWGLAAALESYDSIIPMEDTAKSFGVDLTSVETFARTRVAAAIPAQA